MLSTPKYLTFSLTISVSTQLISSFLFFIVINLTPPANFVSAFSQLDHENDENNFSISNMKTLLTNLSMPKEGFVNQDKIYVKRFFLSLYIKSYSGVTTRTWSPCVIFCEQIDWFIIRYIL